MEVGGSRRYLLAKKHMHFLNSQKQLARNMRYKNPMLVYKGFFFDSERQPRPRCPLMKKPHIIIEPGEAAWVEQNSDDESNRILRRD